MGTGLEKKTVKVQCSQQKSVYLILQTKLDYVPVPGNETEQNCIKNTFFSLEQLSLDSYIFFCHV